MCGCHNNPGVDLRFERSRCNTGEINDEFLRRMDDHRHIGIDAFRFFFTDFNIELLLSDLHDNSSLFVPLDTVYHRFMNVNALRTCADPQD